MILAPSILSADFGILRRQVTEIEEAGAQWLHIDVMDGQFVPNISFGAVVMQSLRPYSKLFFDVHLMIVDPERYIVDFVQAGADSVTIHVEAARNPAAVLRQIHDLGVKAGISLNPETPAEAVFPYLELADMVLVMSVHPGRGGQKYIPESDEKIRAIRKQAGPDYLIQVDGGICQGNIRAVRDCGANVFVAGSAVFTDDIPGACRGLLEAIR